MRQLRERYPNELVVIGVHSAKFPAEKITANIRAAVIRHGIQHPVINDADLAVWRQYAVRAWPTVVLVDPLGKVIAQQTGEIDAMDFIPILDGLIAEFAPRGLLSPRPLPGLLLEVAREPARLLQHPSKILYASGDRLFVADTGHHRVLEVQLSEDGRAGEVVRILGTGEPGLQDGHIHQAQFHAPHGLALHGPTLYVADTENHAIRAIDLAREVVCTVAGTGEKARGLAVKGNLPTTIQLRSPWGLAMLDGMLWIAMAGAHQIWALLVAEKQLAVFAGNGVEALIDGPRGAASFNQPSDLALGLDQLFVADAEASAIRALALDDNSPATSVVTTLVGQGLFAFGDVDGVGEAVCLQHPTGLAVDQGLLYIADSYNHKIKTLDPATGATKTLIGSGVAGATDGDFAQCELFEPQGLTVAQGRLYIADTNNHRIRVADFATQQVVTLSLS